MLCYGPILFDILYTQSTKVVFTIRVLQLAWIRGGNVHYNLENINYILISINSSFFYDI